MTEAYKWQLFIMGFIWGVLTVKVIPLIVKDAFKTVKYFLRQIKKRSAVSSAERNRKNVLKYSIPDYPINFHNQDLERWR
jgi:hypothetical protein